MRDAKHMDDMVIGVTELHCFRFVAPHECQGEGDRGYIGPHATDQGPGIYLKGEGHGCSPCAKPQNASRLLSREEAITLARAIDAVADARPHSNGAFNRGVTDPRATFPGSTEEFVRRWYAVLADRIDLAIDAVEERRASLRELRGSLAAGMRTEPKA